MDLIERLRECCRNVDGDEMAHHAEPWGADVGLLLEAAAALEAAREDGARLDWLAEEAKVGVRLHNGEFNGQHVGLGLSNTNRTLRQAIDQARGKGVKS